jgi:PHO85 cyclin-6/7
MGSLVMTAPQIGHHSYHQVMVDSDPQHGASEVDNQASRYRASSSATAEQQDGRPIPTEPPSPQPRPRDAPQTSNTSSEATMNAHTPATTATAFQSHQPYHPRNMNPQTRGLDQSGFPLTSDPRAIQASPSSPRLQPTYRSARSLAGSEATSPSRIKVRDLSHIQSFASEEYLGRPRLQHRSPSTFSESGRQYEISAMPVSDIIEMVAGLLTKITTTNDRQQEHVQRPIPQPEEQANMSPQTSCVLAFHGKNVPSITILSYLSRIHKYCPTTYEVFLSLLVYFDRMTEMVNRGILRISHRRGTNSSSGTAGSATPTAGSPPSRSESGRPTSQVATPPSSGSMSPSDRRAQEQIPSSPALQGGLNDLSQFFVVDSYNIHRLVIAGVTCASKFFSDVFYTNSRYAKVSLHLNSKLDRDTDNASGRRPPVGRAQSPRTTIPHPQRLPTLHPCRRA